MFLRHLMVFVISSVGAVDLESQFNWTWMGWRWVVDEEMFLPTVCAALDTLDHTAIAVDKVSIVSARTPACFNSGYSSSGFLCKDPGSFPQ